MDISEEVSQPSDGDKWKPNVDGAGEDNQDGGPGAGVAATA